MNTHHAPVVIPPPLLYLLPLGAAEAVHLLWAPLRIFPAPWVGHAVGWPLVLAGLLLFLWSVRTMAGAGTSISPWKPTRALVSSGPFRLGRNPIYLSLTVGYAGGSLILNTAWGLVLLPAALAAVHYLAIIREEEYLERLFGEEYRRYRSRVRRWL